MARILGLDGGRPLADAELDELSERNICAARCRHEHPLQGRQVVAKFAAVADVDGVAFQALDGLGDVLAPDGSFDDVLDVSDR